MKKKLFFALLISGLTFSCSQDENPEPTSEPPINQDIEKKYISTIIGDDDTEFLYEEGLLMKGIDKTSGIFFQVEYNSSNNVERIYTCECGNPENGMNYDIPDEYEYYEVLNYNYKNGEFSKITSDTGKILLEYSYDSEGKVVEVYEAGRYDDSFNEYVLTEFIYDSEGKIESYVSFVSDMGETYSGEIRTDAKINPLYILWQDNSLIIPDNISEISTYNIPFLPNNITSIYKGNELEEKIDLTYDEEYPIYYENILSLGGATQINYLEN